jgi:type II secretory pathway pseudopilin PulG
MREIIKGKLAGKSNGVPGFRWGFALAVIVILSFIIVIILYLIQGFYETADYANARVVYLAARTKATESYATGNYSVPIQEDLIELIGKEINEEAKIEIIDENKDATIDYIIYTKNGLITQYLPGQVIVIREDDKGFKN